MVPTLVVVPCVVINVVRPCFVVAAPNMAINTQCSGHATVSNVAPCNAGGAEPSMAAPVRRQDVGRRGGV